MMICKCGKSMAKINKGINACTCGRVALTLEMPIHTPGLQTPIWLVTEEALTQAIESKASTQHGHTRLMRAG